MSTKRTKTVRIPGVVCKDRGKIGMFIGRGTPEDPVCFTCLEKRMAKAT